MLFVTIWDLPVRRAPLVGEHTGWLGMGITGGTPVAAPVVLLQGDPGGGQGGQVGADHLPG